MVDLQMKTLAMNRKQNQTIYLAINYYVYFVLMNEQNIHDIVIFIIGELHPKRHGMKLIRVNNSSLYC